MNLPATPYLAARPAGDERPRLFCFHHAGGAASTFARWRAAFGSLVDVLPVQLPGRESRIREPRATDLAALVAELDDHLDPFMEPPYLFYGHSMGALVAYHLARSRQARGHGPSALLVGACAPPDRLAGGRDWSDEELTDRLIEIGGMSATLVDHPAWARAAVSLVRADLRLCASHRWSACPPLALPDPRLRRGHGPGGVRRCRRGLGGAHRRRFPTAPPARWPSVHS